MHAVCVCVCVVCVVRVYSCVCGVPGVYLCVCVLCVMCVGVCVGVGGCVVRVGTCTGDTGCAHVLQCVVYTIDNNLFHPFIPSPGHVIFMMSDNL